MVRRMRGEYMRWDYSTKKETEEKYANKKWRGKQTHEEKKNKEIK